MIVGYNVCLETLLQQGISEPVFYGDLFCGFNRIVGGPDFSDQFKKISGRYCKRGAVCVPCGNLAVCGCCPLWLHGGGSGLGGSLGVGI